MVRHAGFLVPVNGLDVLCHAECRLRDLLMLMEVSSVISRENAEAESRASEIRWLGGRVRTNDGNAKPLQVVYTRFDERTAESTSTAA